MVGLLNLPEELIVAILVNLEWRELVKSSQICRQTASTVKNTAALRYAIELGADGLRDGSAVDNRGSSFDKLRRLQAHRDAWTTLSWSPPEKVPMMGQCAAYELVGGVFAKTMPSSNGTTHFVANFLPCRDEPARQLEHADIGIIARDFAIDPSQDLLALLESDMYFQDHRQIAIHLRTLSTNAPHPLAPHCVLRHPCEHRVGRAFMQVFGDVLSLFYWGDRLGPTLFIWNWQTGCVLVHGSTSNGTLSPRVSDFAFLSDRACMLASVDGSGSIMLIRFDDKHQGPAVPPSAGHVATLEFPPVQPGIEIEDLTTHAGPHTAHVVRGRPFGKSADAFVHVLKARYRGLVGATGERRELCHFFIHSRTLLSFMKQTAVAGKPQVHPWDDWQHRARALLTPGHHAWLRYVHGERVVLPTLMEQANPHEPMKELVMILDFGVHPSRAATKEGDPNWGLGLTSEDRVHHVYYPTRISGNGIWTQDIVTSLPYRCLSTTRLANYSGFMIDNERLVGLASTSQQWGDMGDIHVFKF